MAQCSEVYTLVIMAAGLGSRFGKGVKQLQSVGPKGESIMEYSIFDAIDAGFRKVVFITREDLLEQIRDLGDRVAALLGKENVCYVFQKKEDLPEGFTLPADRVKPWGTGQAVLSCRNAVTDPFLVINADDFYGRETYRRMYGFLRHASQMPQENSYAMAGFVLQNTLSDYGTVTRGLCKMDDNNKLLAVCESKGLKKTPDGAVQETENGDIAVDKNTLVSMNMWALRPDFFPTLEEGFRTFLEKHLNDNNEEYLLPVLIGELLKKEKIHVRVLPTKARWFGLTYAQDVSVVQRILSDLTDDHTYPETLFP